jgi:hypothetical protein
MKVGIYSPLTPLPSLVGNGYIIYLLLILMLLKGTATAEGTTHGNSWIFAIAVLLPVDSGRMLLGSFHWRSNEEIPTLTLMVCALH